MPKSSKMPKVEEIYDLYSFDPILPFSEIDFWAMEIEDQFNQSSPDSYELARELFTYSQTIQND